MSLDLVLSPYDLTARSAAAVSASLLADRVVTLMPGPGREMPRDPAALARHGSPAFERLAEAWAWSGPLWRSGAMVAGMDGAAVAEALRTARAGIDRDPSMSALAALMIRTDPADNDATRFEAICRDLLTGGINPSVTVPLNAALEAFACRHGLTLVRGPSRSVVGRLEKANQRVVFRLSVLAAVEADASDLVHLRAAVSASAAPFREAIARLLDSTSRRAHTTEIVHALGEADAHRAAFESALQDRIERLRAGPTFSGQRLKIARVTLTGASQEIGAGVMAARRAAAALESRAATGPRTHPPSGGFDAPQTSLAPGPLAVLTIKPATMHLRGN